MREKKIYQIALVIILIVIQFVTFVHGQTNHDQISLRARDLYLLARDWMQSAVSNHKGDLDQSGFVDKNDLTLLIQKRYPRPIFTSTPTINPSWSPTPTVNPSPSPTPTINPSWSPTPTVNPSHSPTPTWIATPSVNPLWTPIPTRTSTPTWDPTKPTWTPHPSSEKIPNNNSTPQTTPSNITTPSPTQKPAPPVRQWNIHRAFSLFFTPVELPSAEGIASNELGYSVYTKSKEGESQFVSFDRFGRIYTRTLNITRTDFSSLALVNGYNLFGRFLESPSNTRRFHFERFNLESPIEGLFQVDHLAADAIDLSFAGSKDGYAMTVLRYPNLINVHRIDKDGNLLGTTEIESPIPLPTDPHILKTLISGNQIIILYSSNYNPSTASSTPIYIWPLLMDGRVTRDTPFSIPVDLSREAIIGDGNGNFYFIGQNEFGPQLYRIIEGVLNIEQILPIDQVIDIEWQDETLWLLDGDNHSLYGFSNTGEQKVGPIGIYPPGWNASLEWLYLKKSGPDMGVFFTDYESKESVYYMQIEQGPMVTPTPTPAPGIPTGETVEVEIDDGIIIEMVKIPAGSYMRGSPKSEQGRNFNEGPQHQVTLTNDFFISKYEITNKLYKIFEPRHYISDYGVHGEDIEMLPVANVSWDNAKEFCEWLSDNSEFTFDLPTEAEWEYVCRGGTSTRRPWGDDLDNTLAVSHANVADVSSATSYNFTSKFPGNDGFAGYAPVGSFPANPYGVYDMLGNVWEWCSDWFSLYTEEPQTNPTGPTNGSSKVFRGGSWQDGPTKVRSAYRSGLTPDESHPAIGFRVVIHE